MRRKGVAITQELVYVILAVAVAVGLLMATYYYLGPIVGLRKDMLLFLPILIRRRKGLEEETLTRIVKIFVIIVVLAVILWVGISVARGSLDIFRTATRVGG